MWSIDLTTLLAIALLLYAWWPGSLGRYHWTGRLITLSLLSPVLRYLSALFTFSIRLQLSQWAGQLLQWVGFDVQVEGNVLILAKSGAGPIEMAVDPACMGLQLTGVSLLVGLFALIWQERLQRHLVALHWITVYLSLVFVFILACNLFRIVLLVAFGAMPDSWAHEVIGLVCVAVYAWFPSWCMARWVVHKVGKPEMITQPSTAILFKSARWGIGLLAIGLSIRSLAGLPTSTRLSRETIHELVSTIKISDDKEYDVKTLANGFIRCAKPGVLIYLKPQPDWFSADHSPMACWQGSGYELKRVRETQLEGHPAYVGELRKKGQVLYTAWWFTNGLTTTISQLTMRGRMLRGETKFALINVTADRPFTQL